MRLGLRGLRLGHKLSLFVTLAVLLAILALGVNFELMLRQSFLDNTRTHMVHAFQQLGTNLDKIETDLKSGAYLASHEESSIASIELINQYQDKAQYNTAFIDEEKKSLAKKALDRVKFSQSDDMAIYDQNNELLAFASRKLGAYQLGYLSFATGQAKTMLRPESGLEFLPDPSPSGDLHDELHVARAVREKNTLEPVLSHLRRGDKLVIRSHQNVFDPASKRYLGHVEFLYVFDLSIIHI